MEVATHSDLQDNRPRAVARLTTSEKLSDYVKEFYRGSLDGIVLSVDEDSDARKDVETPSRAFKFHPFYFSIGIVFPFSDFQSEFLCFYSYAPCQWTPESYRLVVAFERLNKWYNIGMGLNEFRALFRVTCQSTLRQYISFHATGKWTEHPFVQGVKTDRDWNLDVIRVSGKWESQNNKFPIPTTWKHEKNFDALNRVESVRVDLIDAFYSIPSNLRVLEWVINPINDKAEARDWVRPFVDAGANPIFASGDELKIMYDKHLVLLGKKKFRSRKGSGPARGVAVEYRDKTRKRKMEVMNPNSVVCKSSSIGPDDEASTSDIMPFERTTDVEEIFENPGLHDSDGISPGYSQMQVADEMTRHVDYMPLSTDNNSLCNITPSSKMNDETNVLCMGPDNLPQLSSIKDGCAAEIWADAIFSPTDANMWLSQTIQSLHEDIFFGWYQNMGRTKALICKYASLHKEATHGWEIDKAKLMSATNKCHALEVELDDTNERFKGMKDNLENQVAAARFGIECKNNNIAKLEQHIAEMKTSNEKEMQNLKNQHEARLIEMEDDKCAAIEIARETVMKELVGNSDEDESDEA